MPGFAGDGLGAEALLGDFVGLALGFFVVLAALFFVALARFRRRALGALDFFAALADARFFLGDLALFRLAQTRVGERMRARAALFLGERAQHDAGGFRSSSGGRQPERRPAQRSQRACGRGGALRRGASIRRLRFRLAPRPDRCGA